MIDLEQFTRHLAELGYEKNYQVQTSGEFSVRGGIIDIFPLTEENPFRIELWDDEVDSIAVSTRKASGLWNSWKKFHLSFSRDHFNKKAVRSRD